MMMPAAKATMRTIWRVFFRRPLASGPIRDAGQTAAAFTHPAGRGGAVRLQQLVASLPLLASLVRVSVGLMAQVEVIANGIGHKRMSRRNAV